jgi:hypothetical protein
MNSEYNPELRGFTVYKYLKLKGEAANFKEVKSFFFFMFGVYENVRNSIRKESLNLHENYTTTHMVFKDIRCDCPYSF